MSNASGQSALHSFEPSSGQVIKAYIDGSCLKNGSPDAVGGVGAIITPSDSNDIFRISRPLNSDKRMTSSRVDYLAVTSALDKIKEEYSTDVEVYIYSNHKSLVQQLQGNNDVDQSLLKFYWETQEYLNKFQDRRVKQLGETESPNIREASELAKAGAYKGDSK